MKPFLFFLGVLCVPSLLLAQTAPKVRMGYTSINIQ
jgi:hypothetical protein